MTVARPVTVPLKVISPTLLSRMKKRNHCTCVGVGSLCANALMTITALTGQRKVIQGGRAALTVGENVFDSKHIGRVGFLALAIFTEVFGATRDGIAKTLGNVDFRHGAVEYPVLASAQEGLSVAI